MSISFRIFGDLHYIDEVPDWSDKRKLVEYSDIMLDKLIKSTNDNDKLKFIINLGDLIQSTGNKYQDLNNLKFALDKMKKIKLPIYNILGNHELKSVNSNKEIIKLFGYSKSSYSFNYDNYHFLIVGTDINHDDKNFKTQYVSNEDMMWIKKDLEENKGKKIIVFCHFGIIDDKEIMSNYWAYTENGENLMLRNRKELLDILSPYNVIGMLCGHQHWTKKLPYKNHYCYMLGSLTENIKNDGKPDGVFFDVTLDNNQISVEEKHL
ncbi:MAG: metallophosphoesterase [Bacilli bacterium]|nr:metallophosphoesterase [Bacilli bacterium]